MRLLPYGDTAGLFEAEPDELRTIVAALGRRAPPGVVDVVPAERTVLVRVARPADLAAACAFVAALEAAALEIDPAVETASVETESPETDEPGRTDTVTIPVTYDGADLQEVAELTGLSVAGVVQAHTATAWTVAFCGFAPGFAYLTGGDPRLAVSRRDSPRARVPRGSVALAGSYSAVYPGQSPGGWRLIGRTDMSVWDLNRDPPARLRPGVRVTFTDASRENPGDRGAHVDARPPSLHPDRSADAPRSARYLDVLASGPLATVQDLGRPGYAAVGVSPSGTADRGALALANRLVGNDVAAAGLELTLGGLSVRASADLIVAASGAAAAPEVDGRPVGMNAAVRVPAGTVVRLGRPDVGLRTYLAVRGGIDVPAVLGSRSFDVLSGIGPPPLSPGDRLPIGPARGPLPGIDVAPVPSRSGATVILHWTPGPRADRLTTTGRDVLRGTTWTVGADSNRVGVRLDGPALDCSNGPELASEGLVRGAVQVPTSGRPVIFLADHPTTGGYPVVAVVDDADTDALAQVRPGDRVELRPWRRHGGRR